MGPWLGRRRLRNISYPKDNAHISVRIVPVRGVAPALRVGFCRRWCSIVSSPDSAAAVVSSERRKEAATGSADRPFPHQGLTAALGISFPLHAGGPTRISRGLLWACGCGSFGVTTIVVFPRLPQPSHCPHLPKPPRRPRLHNPRHCRLHQLLPHPRQPLLHCVSP
jgi:hypothetical protein